MVILSASTVIQGATGSVFKPPKFDGYVHVGAYEKGTSAGYTYISGSGDGTSVMINLNSFLDSAARSSLLDQVFLADTSKSPSQLQSEYSSYTKQNANDTCIDTLLDLYGCYLVYMDWFSGNWFAKDDAKYSIFDLEVQDHMGATYRVADLGLSIGTGEEYVKNNIVDALGNIHNSAISSNKYPKENYWFESGGTKYYITGISNHFNVDSGLSLNSIVDTDRFYNELVSLCRDFLDKGLLNSLALANEMGKEEEIKGWSYATAKSKCGTGSSPLLVDYNGTASSTGEAVAVSNTGFNDEIIDESNERAGDVALSKEQAVTLFRNHPQICQFYLNTFNRINSLYGTLGTIGISDYVPNPNDLSETYYSFHRDSTLDTRSLLNEMSPTFQALYTSGISGALSGNYSDIGRADIIRDVDTNNGVFGLLVHNGKIVDGQLKSDGEMQLSDVGYVMLAAGVVYDPFISVAGNESWSDVVSGFLSSEEQKQNVMQIIQIAFNTKKPLYVLDGKLDSWLTKDSLPEVESGIYREAYLADMLQDDEDVTRIYATIRGKMEPSHVDGSTYDFIRKPDTIDLKQTTSEVHVDTNVKSDVKGNVTQSNTDDKKEETADTDELITTGEPQITATKGQMTSPIAMTSGWKEKWEGVLATGYCSAIGGLTSVILHNAAVDTRDNEYVKQSTKYRLFVNGLGDIVLADGTVILPAIDNPCLYNYTEPPKGKAGDQFYDDIASSTDFMAYYPYNAAFMNHYPSAIMTEEKKLEINKTNASDLDKYMLIAKSSMADSIWGLTTLYAKKIEKIGSKDRLATVSQAGSLRSASFKPNSFRVDEDLEKSYSLVSIAEGSDDFTGWFNKEFKDESGTNDSVNDRSKTKFILRSSCWNGDHKSFFPLYNDSIDTREDFLDLAGPITFSALRYISNDNGSTSERISAGTLRIDDYILDFIGESLLGTQYAQQIVKNEKMSYEALVQDQSNRFEKFIIQIVQSVMETFGKVDGVLSIKGPYDNGFFNKIFRFTQDFYLIICVILLVVVAAKFFKGHFNILYVVFIGCLCVGGFEVYANWLPTLLPQMYNFVVNDIIENVVWKTVFYNAENYEDTYKNSDNVDTVTGAPKPYTSTITLYQLTNAEMVEVSNKTGISLEELRKGIAVDLDAGTGIYAQGNQIKMSVDSLLASNSMRGLYYKQWEMLDAGEDVGEDSLLIAIDGYNPNPYSIQLIAPAVSLEAYYTPYDHFERALISQLNTFANYFLIERRVFSYGENNKFYKDSFLVTAFINSGLFTAPNDDSVLKNNIAVDTIKVQVNNPDDVFTSFDVEDLLVEIKKAFAPQEDWLGIVKVFAEPNRGIQNSLWGSMMYERGWYDKNWVMTEKGEKDVSDLVRYINNQTKLWIINNYDDISYLSDENAIKMISLYATTCFTHYMSDIGRWLYPNYINASDIELKDVLYGSMVSLQDKNFAYDGTIVNTIGLNIGVTGVIMILFIIVFASVFIVVITYLIPILYGLLGGIIIFKLLNSQDNLGVLKGYTKVTLVTMILYIMFSLTIQLVGFGGYKWYGYLLCAVCLLLINYFLFWVVISVFTDIPELGNNTLMNNLLRGLDKLSFGSVSRLTASNAHIHGTNKRTVIAPNIAYNYSRSFNVDDYDRPYSHRFLNHGLINHKFKSNHRPIYGYGRNDYYTDGTDTRNARFFRNRSKRNRFNY